MTDIKWLKDNQIQISIPKRTKKITGTRFATIFGANPWSTDFEIWCAITKCYEKPFEDTKYTLAGKTIEPKQAKYLENSYGMDIIRPSDIWGKDYFKTTWGDFYPDNPVFGGMWDYLKLGANDKIEAVLEMKTTKRVENWAEDIPEYYALQAALYAYLSNVDKVIMVCSFLSENDYLNPDEYTPNVDNTILREFNVSERYPMFDLYISIATDWWKEYVETGISPKYDEKKDAEILDALRTTKVNIDDSLESLISEGESLQDEINAVKTTISDKEKKLTAIKNQIKEKLTRMMGKKDKKAEIKGSRYIWSISKSISESVDSDALKKDGLWEKYGKSSPSYRLSVKEIK